MRWAVSRARRLVRGPWLNSTPILGVSLGGLLIAIAVAGIVGLAINQNVHQITERALEYDIEIEDEEGRSPGCHPRPPALSP